MPSIRKARFFNQVTKTGHFRDVHKLHYLIAFQHHATTTTTTKHAARTGENYGDQHRVVNPRCHYLRNGKKIKQLLEVIITLTLQKSHADTKLYCEDPALLSWT